MDNINKDELLAKLSRIKINLLKAEDEIRETENYIRNEQSELKNRYYNPDDYLENMFGPCAYCTEMNCECCCYFSGESESPK